MSLKLKLYHIENFTMDKTNQHPVGDRCILVGIDIEKTPTTKIEAMS